MAKRTRREVAPRSAPRLTRQQASRLERERRHQRILYGTMGVTAVVVALLIGVGLLYDRVLLPSQAVLTVNGETVTRETYWAFRRYQVGQQLQQLQFQAQFGQSADVVRQRMEALQSELRETRSAPLDVPTLEQLATNILLKQRADQLGVEVSEAEVQAAIQRQFAPPPATPTPVAAAEATQTAVAATAAATLTPPATGQESQSAGTGTPAAAVATPTTGPTATPTPFYTPTATVTPTPMSEAAQATAMATFRDQMGALRQVYGMTAEQYRELVVEPDLLQEEIKQAIAQEIPDVQPQVHAAHILVQSQEAAEEIRAKLAQGADFAQLAKEQSTDPSNKDTGGDLGWFPRGIMDPAFEKVAFELEPGTLSEPVKTDFGWHIIKVLEKAEARPVEPNLLEQLRENRYQAWLTEQRQMSSVTSEVLLPSFAPTPTPSPVETSTP